jgi:biopolymer transport protein ExbD
MQFKRHLHLEKGQLNITPLIDVVFQLLIFFMLTSTFISQPGIKINLPKAVTSEVISEKIIVVTITKDNVIYLDSEPCTLEKLKNRLESAAKEQWPLLIKADRSSALGKIVEVWDLCRDMGISQINVATTQE